MATLRRTKINPHARLFALADGLKRGTLDAQHRCQIAEMIERIAGGDDATAALGLKRRPGQRQWTTCAALAERDRHLCEAAMRFFLGLSFAEQARRLHTELLRYHATAWQRERTLDACPDRHTGNLHEFLWRALKAHDHVPAARSIRLILARS